MSEPVVLDSVRGLRALLDRIASRQSSSVVGNVSFQANCRLPLSPSQSLLLADLVTALGQHSTWLSIEEMSEYWLACGVAGEDSGPRVTVFISVTSDRDVDPCQ